MEDLFLLIIKEATGTKYNTLRQTAQIAYDKLYRQHGIHRDPSHELRSVCFTALQMALDTRRPKFITIGLNGLHRIIKDERFYIGLEPEDDSVWLPAQLLRATSGILPTTSNEETVVNVLRLFLAMACSPACTLNGRLLIEILSRCGECWETGSRATKALQSIALAAASQCLRTFCSFLVEESEEIKKTAPVVSTSVTQTQASAVYNEVIPVMQWLCSRLATPNSNDSPNKKYENNTSLFWMECILTLTSSLPPNVSANPHFRSFLWQKFCPTLAANVTPNRFCLDKKFSYKDALHMLETETRGFFNGPDSSPQARCVYLTGIQLLRVTGAHASLRPMLEALFHRMLLLPAPQNRAEPLKCVREIFKSPERLIDLCVILYTDKQNNGSDEMALFRLMIDAIEECAAAAATDSSMEESFEASVQCMVSLLNSLQTFCSDDFNDSIISEQVTNVINNRYESLKEADYTGPLTYQSLARLPAYYRDVVVELKNGQNGFEASGSSGSESEIENNHHDDISNASLDTDEDDQPSVSSEEERNRWPYTQLEMPSIPVRVDFDADRKHARDFAKQLRCDLVPKLLQLRSCIEVDEALQEFASSVCQENSLNYSDFDSNLTALNADGIYLATYSALLLSLQLARLNYYEESQNKVSIPLSEEQFVASIQNTGILVYLSTPWLCELYQSIVISNVLEAVSKENLENTSTRCALIDVLCDAGGLGSTQMLSEWARLQAVSSNNNHEKNNERRDAIKKLARRLLTCCWDSMVMVLSTGLGDMRASGKKNFAGFSKRPLRLKAKVKRSNGETLYALCLDGLHTAATLSNCLHLQHLADKILQLLASNVCKTMGPRITGSQAMSMDVILKDGLILGSYSPECWHSIFAVCKHVTQLEHEIFSAPNPPALSIPPESDSSEKFSAASGKGSEKMNAAIAIDEDEMCVDVYSFLQAPLKPTTNNVSSVLKIYSGTNETVLLNQGDSCKVLSALVLQTENLFKDAAERLSLPTLCHFLKSLCKASREQLFKTVSTRQGRRMWWPTKGWKKNYLPISLLFHRVGDVTLKVFRSSRPLLHILKVWAITGPHLMDAACHRDRIISRRGIEYIHDIITAMLVEQSELPHFHFNEALLKPFENLLSMDTCDSDVQDQIVSCFYEIVETHRTEIRSGWRPLFGTLRNSRNRISNVNNIADIFRVFLDSDNMLVFSNAGLDCILCLLSFLEVSSEAGTATIPEDDTTFRTTQFLHDSLTFLERCSHILGFMFNMPKCPSFHTIYKIKGMSYNHIIDANIPNSMENFSYFGNDYLQTKNEHHMISYRSLHIDKDGMVKIDELDRKSGVLKVWFLLLDGLTNSLIVCPVAYQASILQTTIKLFKNLLNPPFIDFGLYCINHLLIPMVQDWLRHINKTGVPWSAVEKNFKHCCCMTTDLIVEFIEKCAAESASESGQRAEGFTENTIPKANNVASNEYSSSEESVSLNAPESANSKMSASATLALKQLLLLLIECSAQSQESVARSGVSCIKHVILSTGHLFNDTQWMIACSAIHRACTVTVAPLRQLSFAFHEKSNSFYGDCANVKVAARRDSTLDELSRVYTLAQQVFLSDQPSPLSSGKAVDKHLLDDRSFSFLLYPLNNGFNTNLENYVIRVPFKSIVVGLLANQMLLQLVAKLLLSHLKCVPQTVSTCIFDSYADSMQNYANYELDFRSREILLRCVKQFLTSSLEFDSRPGLKFLMQKVANIEYAANLYKQMTSSWMIYYIALVDSYLSDIKIYELGMDDLNFILESCSRVNTTTVKKKENFVRYLFCLQDAWDLVCELYLNNSNLHSLENGQVGIDDGSTKSSTLSFLNGNIGNETIKASTDKIDIELGDLNTSDRLGPLEESNCNANTSTLANVPVRCRNNPFDVINRPQASDPDIVSPEIEQQRAASILKDSSYKRAALAQLVVASLELLRSLPRESEDNLRLLMTPTIREAFRLVQVQGNELKINEF